MLLLLLTRFSRVRLCVTHRWQPTRLPHPWDSPGKNTGVGCHFLLQCVKVKSLSPVRLLMTPWTAAHQAPPSMRFSRQECWSGDDYQKNHNFNYMDLCWQSDVSAFYYSVQVCHSFLPRSKRLLIS